MTPLLSSIPTGPSSAASSGATLRTNAGPLWACRAGSEGSYLGLSVSQACGVGGGGARCQKPFPAPEFRVCGMGRRGCRGPSKNFCPCSLQNTTPIVPDFSPPCSSREDKESRPRVLNQLADHGHSEGHRG